MRITIRQLSFAIERMRLLADEDPRRHEVDILISNSRGPFGTLPTGNAVHDKVLERPTVKFTKLDDEWGIEL